QSLAPLACDERSRVAGRVFRRKNRAVPEEFFKVPPIPTTTTIPYAGGAPTRSAIPVEDGQPLLEVRDLHTWFPIKKGVFQRTVGQVKAVDGVSFDVH